MKRLIISVVSFIGMILVAETSILLSLGLLLLSAYTALTIDWDKLDLKWIE